jgi:hypothetical protein
MTSTVDAILESAPFLNRCSGTVPQGPPKGIPKAYSKVKVAPKVLYKVPYIEQLGLA